MWTPGPGRAFPGRKALAALTLLLVASAGLAGCTGERRLEAADRTEAPLVTIRTLSPAESRTPAKPALHPAVVAEALKAEPPKPAAPRRTRRRARRIRREQPIAPVAAPVAVAPEKGPVETLAPVELPEPRLSFPMKSPAPESKQAPEPQPASDPEPIPDPGN